MVSTGMVTIKNKLRRRYFSVNMDIYTPAAQPSRAATKTLPSRTRRLQSPSSSALFAESISKNEYTFIARKYVPARICIKTSIIQ